MSNYPAGYTEPPSIDDYIDAATKDLQRKLLASQASEARRADWLWIQLMDWCKATGRAPAQENSLFKIVSRMRESTQPNTAELDAYVDSEIDKRLGEPVAWSWDNDGVIEYSIDVYAKEYYEKHYGVVMTSLYAKKG